MKEVTFCPRCKRTIPIAAIKTHECSPEIRDIVEIISDDFTQFDNRETGDTVISITSLDGIIYRHLICKHYPPHSTVNRDVTDKDINHKGNSTEIRWL